MRKGNRGWGDVLFRPIVSCNLMYKRNLTYVCNAGGKKGEGKVSERKKGLEGSLVRTTGKTISSTTIYNETLVCAI